MALSIRLVIVALFGVTQFAASGFSQSAKDSLQNFQDPLLLQPRHATGQVVGEDSKSAERILTVNSG